MNDDSHDDDNDPPIATYDGWDLVEDDQHDRDDSRRTTFYAVKGVERVALDWTSFEEPSALMFRAMVRLGFPNRADAAPPGACSGPFTEARLLAHLLTPIPAGDTFETLVGALRMLMATPRHPAPGAANVNLAKYHLCAALTEICR